MKKTQILGLPPEEYISVIGGNLFQPLVDSIDPIIYGAQRKPGRFKTVDRENGYSIAAIVLMAMILESFSRRAYYIYASRNEFPQRVTFDIWSELPKIFPKYRRYKAIEEALQLRNCLVHNHIYEGSFEWGSKSVRVLYRQQAEGTKTTRKSVKYDKKFVTRLLGLNLDPMLVGRREVCTISALTLHFLTFLERQDRAYAYVSQVNVRLRGNQVKFLDVLRFASGMRPYLQMSILHSPSYRCWM